MSMLSNFDIEDFFTNKENNIEIIQYDNIDFTNYLNLYDKLKNTDLVVLIPGYDFVTKEFLPTNGHWICVYMTNEKKPLLNIFDSFGRLPDCYFNELKDQRKYHYKKLISFINYLWQNNYPVNYNNYKLQDDDSNHCGRWVCCRLFFKDLNDKEFKQLMNGFKKKDNLDIETIYNKLIPIKS